MENNPYALNIYPQAQADLEELFRHIAQELGNPSAAAALIDELEEALDLVCRNPLMCPLVRSSLMKDQTLRKLLVKNYIVFYRPMEGSREIQVVRVLYGMMDYERLL